MLNFFSPFIFDNYENVCHTLAAVLNASEYSAQYKLHSHFGELLCNHLVIFTNFLSIISSLFTIALWVSLTFLSQSTILLFFLLLSCLLSVFSHGAFTKSLIFIKILLLISQCLLLQNTMH